jgi:hypothetical protein
MKIYKGKWYLILWTKCLEFEIGWFNGNLFKLLEITLFRIENSGFIIFSIKIAKFYIGFYIDLT